MTAVQEEVRPCLNVLSQLHLALIITSGGRHCDFIPIFTNEETEAEGNEASRTNKAPRRESGPLTSQPELVMIASSCIVCFSGVFYT